MSLNRPIQEEDLLAYVDDALDEASRRQVEDYLSRHPDVARRIGGYAAQRQALRDALAPVAHEPIPPELNLARMLEARRARRAAPWRVAAALVLAFGLGGMGGWSMRAGMPETVASAGIAALAREAAASYRVYASDPARPVEMGAADRDTLVRWVSSRLQRPVALPDLSDAGYRYMGGRLVATEHGPAGLFMYDDAHGTRVAMLVRPMAVQGDMPMKAHAQEGVAGYAWAASGLGYSLVAAESAQDLHPLADEMRRRIADSFRQG